MNIKHAPNVRALAHIVSRITGSLPEAGHPSSRRLHAEATRLRNGAEALANMYATANPTETVAANEKRVALAAKRYAAETLATRDRMHTILREGLIEVEKRINAKVNLTPNDFAAEIRAMYRQMDGAARSSLLADLVNANRGPELAAIVKAPAILTGIDETLQSRMAEAIVAKHAPDEFAEQAAMLEVFDSTLTAASVASKVADDYSDPARLASIERGEAMAAAAAAEFANALAPAA